MFVYNLLYLTVTVQYLKMRKFMLKEKIVKITILNSSKMDLDFTAKLQASLHALSSSSSKNSVGSYPNSDDEEDEYNQVIIV
jgi:hypothetical protein